MPNRYICQVLEEMRQCTKTLNFSYLLGLIEEVQTMANRMESRLEDIADIEHYESRRIELNAEIRALQKEKDKLENA